MKWECFLNKSESDINPLVYQHIADEAFANLIELEDSKSSDTEIKCNVELVDYEYRTFFGAKKNTVKLPKFVKIVEGYRLEKRDIVDSLHPTKAAGEKMGEKLTEQIIAAIEGRI